MGSWTQCLLKLIRENFRLESRIEQQQALAAEYLISTWHPEHPAQRWFYVGRIYPKKVLAPIFLCIQMKYVGRLKLIWFPLRIQGGVLYAPEKLTQWIKAEIEELFHHAATTSSTCCYKGHQCTAYYWRVRILQSGQKIVKCNKVKLEQVDGMLKLRLRRNFPFYNQHFKLN